MVVKVRASVQSYFIYEAARSVFLCVCVCVRVRVCVEREMGEDLFLEALQSTSASI